MFTMTLGEGEIYIFGGSTVVDEDGPEMVVCGYIEVVNTVKGNILFFVLYGLALRKTLF